ncbi:MAG: dihydrolipoyl dehydrogenase [Candidatus Altiarchaeota archaeon]
MRHDAVVIGGGPGGYECALWMSKLGGSAIVVERGELGGVCTNRGCIPTKALVASCEAYETVRRAQEFGISVQSSGVDSETVFKRRDRIALTMRKGVEKLLSDAKVEVVKGEAKIKSSTEVEVAGRVIQAKNIVVATGSEPLGLPGIGLDHEYVISGDDAATSSKLPKNIVVIGGGFIGCEYASLYSKLGSNVTLVEALPRILPTEDEDVSDTLHKILSKEMRVLTGVKVESVDMEGKSVKVAGEDIPADLVLLAVGRMPIIPEGANGIGVVHNKDGITVDSRMRTNVRSVYAIGDVTSNLKLAHTAYAGAEAAAKNIMGQDFEVDFSVVPWCVFTTPEVARVGVTEKQAGDKAKIGIADYMANGKARCMGERSGFCKVIADSKTDAIIGVHILGAHASSLIGEAALAVKERLTTEQVAQTIHPHPTLNELIKEACEKAAE